MWELTKAKQFAEFEHRGQRYDHHEYIYHLEQTVKILKEYGFPEKHQIAGYLHDVMEDQNIKYKVIEKEFDSWIAEIVYCCTDELGRNREERKKKTYPKLQNNKDAIIVKLADRIANVRYSKESGIRHFQVYKKEHNFFTQQLLAINTDERVLDMWSELDNLLGFNCTGIY